MGERILEIPAGKLDPGELPEVCARRELEEETGRKASELESLGWIWTTPGFTDEKIWIYLARGLEQGVQALEAGEDLDVLELPLEQACDLAASGEIVDGKTICALMRAKAKLGA